MMGHMKLSTWLIKDGGRLTHLITFPLLDERVKAIHRVKCIKYKSKEMGEGMYIEIKA